MAHSDEGGSKDRVVFEQTNKLFAGTHAVKNLDLRIREGEFFTLLGPSGSGKTTTLRMLAGLEAPTSGSIKVDGRDVTRDVPEKRNIGLVFQNYALFPHMTVTENVGFSLKMRRGKKADIQSRVDAVLAMTALTEYHDRYPSQLSGGQQQRVALARAFVFDPSILLMDEPLGALDRNLRDHMRVELKDLQRRIGATVMYVTHDQDEALALSDRIGIMHQGVLQQVAAPQEMYERPANSFVAKFLGGSVCLPARRRPAGSEVVVDVEGLSHAVRISADGDVCSDESGMFMIRPEKFTIETSEPDAQEINRLSGIVETTVYLGSAYQVYLRESAGARVHLVVPAASRANLVPGTKVWATWSPADCRFLPVVD
jgi:putative spermidine/putrescine transport system ATP-binding protein